MNMCMVHIQLIESSGANSLSTIFRTNSALVSFIQGLEGSVPEPPSDVTSPWEAELREAGWEKDSDSDSE